MPRISLSLFFLLFFAVCSYSQVIKGVVVDAQDEPIVAASIFISENKQGTIANEKGEFQLKLSEGKYTLEVRSMGYITETVLIEVGTEDMNLEIELRSRDIQLLEVEVTRGEDPAYEIMRKAIAKAPYYQSVVKESHYENYTKGSAKILSLPKMVEMSADKEDKDYIDIYTNRLFVLESVNEMHFTAPNKYEQKVIAFSSTIPYMDNPDMAIGMGMVSLYWPTWGDMISPLNPKAFDYYRFRYEGYEEENGQVIFIIRIIPKLSDPKLIDGVFYIADEEWNIRFADINTKGMGMKTRYIFNYHPVVDDVYLVTNYESQIDFAMFGFKMEASFLSSVKYEDIQLNDSLIMAYEKEHKLKKLKREKRSLNLSENKNSNRIVDSLAMQRDSSWWDSMRTIVLSDEELKSYQDRDTLKHKIDSLDNKSRNPKFTPMDLLLGGTIGSDSSFMYFRYNGLAGGLLKDYNYVDGWWMGQSFELDFKKHKNKGLIIKPEAYWTFARKALVWNVDAFFYYAPMRFGKLSLTAGHSSADYSGEAGVEPFLNMLFCFERGRNPRKYYDKRYIGISNKIDLANGLQLNLGIEGAYRDPLEINTTWNLFGVKNRWTENRPNYPGAINENYDMSLKYDVGLKYTPRNYYRVFDGKKEYVYSDYPTFELSYSHGLNKVPKSILSPDSYNRLSSFAKIEFSVKQTVKLGYFSNLDYTLTAGKFLNSNEFSYVDYKHFNTSALWMTFKNLNSSYALLPYYTHSTNKEWAQAFLNYSSDYILLKRLPFLQGKMFQEVLQGKFLYTPDKPCYWELGYSVDFLNMLAAGVFVSFDKADFNAVGFKVSIPFLQTVSDAGASRSISISF